ncbi:hypothetical protein L195_g051269, partial [Trifolium pratense]
VVSQAATSNSPCVKLAPAVNKLPSLITVASTQDIHSHTTLVYLPLKPIFFHQSLNPVDVEYYSTASPGRCRVLLSSPLQDDVEYSYHRLSRLMSSITITASPD